MSDTAHKTLLLDQDTVRQLLSIRDINDAVRDAFKGYGNNTVKNPTKVTLDLGESDDWPAYEGFVNAMPAYIGDEDIAGLKWVAGIRGEREKAGLPYITGLILLLDPHLGHFLAILDGTYITDLRTGAQAANVVRFLANGKKEISLGLYGAGRQAETSLITLNDLFTIKDLYLWNYKEDELEGFVEKVKDYAENIHTVPSDEPEKASHEEFTITATAAPEPFLKGEWFDKGQKVITLGSGNEAEKALIAKADHIFTDHIGQAAHRGSLSLVADDDDFSRDDITATIGELAAGKVDAATLDDSLVFTGIIGTGAMDISVAKRAYDKAIEQGVGTEFDFGA